MKKFYFLFVGIILTGCLSGGNSEFIGGWLVVKPEFAAGQLSVVIKDNGGNKVLTEYNQPLPLVGGKTSAGEVKEGVLKDGGLLMVGCQIIKSTGNMACGQLEFKKLK